MPSIIWRASVIFLSSTRISCSKHSRTSNSLYCMGCCTVLEKSSNLLKFLKVQRCFDKLYVGLRNLPARQNSKLHFIAGRLGHSVEKTIVLIAETNIDQGCLFNAAPPTRTIEAKKNFHTHRKYLSFAIYLHFQCKFSCNPRRWYSRPITSNL